MAQPPQAEGTSKGGLIAGIITLAVIVGIAVGVQMAFSVKLGGACEGSAFGCERGALCVDDSERGKVCMKSCESDADCQAGETCDTLMVFGSDEKKSACSR